MRFSKLAFGLGPMLEIIFYVLRLISGELLEIALDLGFSLAWQLAPLAMASLLMLIVWLAC